MNRKLTFTLTEQANPLRTRSIADLCDYLTDRLLVPQFAANGANWRREYMNFFTFDNTCDPLQPTGTLFFHVPPLFAGCSASLEAAILSELGRLQIKAGPIVHEPRAAAADVITMRIPIVDNPTALLQPPEVNMSRTRGAVVLRDLLGYQPTNGRYEFTADDVLQRLAGVTEERVAACTASPVKEKAAASSRVQREPSLVSMRAVRRCLDEVRQFAEWALRHNYRRLSAI
ncbi:MAG: hypothetical protein HZC55_02155 [Verrucomicrobia bacterium]|nr:hypothetical protein [Verrucomicrobiota bacterium]